NRNENMTMLYGKYGYNDNDTASLAPVSYLFCYSFCFLMVLNFYIFLEFRECWVGWGVVCGFMFNILGSIYSTPLAHPYLKDQIIGPDYRIIQCGQIDSLGSWQDQWCTYHQHRIILSWLFIFVWLMPLFIYFSISLLIALLILCKRRYRISKLWVVYQYQYKKGLFLEWLKEQKKKSRQRIEPETTKNVKSNMVNKEINKVEVVIVNK
ncbi:19330_t:CDS:2, partial [Gigaspora rosea]